MYQLVEELLDSGLEMAIEPWPRAGRSYPRVSWIIRELKYWQILGELDHDLDTDKAPLKSVRGPIYRIVPNHRGERGRAEINSINALAGTSYKFTREIVESVQDDGHIPMVRIVRCTLHGLHRVSDTFDNCLHDCMSTGTPHLNVLRKQEIRVNKARPNGIGGFGNPLDGFHQAATHHRQIMVEPRGKIGRLPDAG